MVKWNFTTREVVIKEQLFMVMQAKQDGLGVILL